MLGLFQRKDRLIVHGEAPYNAEPPLDRLRAAFLTDQADFYVRSHGDIPDLDADGYRLTVDGMVATPLELSVADLKARFAHVTVTAVIPLTMRAQSARRNIGEFTGQRRRLISNLQKKKF